MAEKVAAPNDVGPRQVGKARLLRIRDVPAGFGHDLDATLDRPPRPKISLEGCSFNDADRTFAAIKGAEGKRLTYRQPHGSHVSV